MEAIFKISFIVFIIFSINNFHIESGSIDIRETNDYSDSYLSTDEKTFYNNDSNVLFGNESYEESDGSEGCSLDSFIDNANNYLPDDYEENEKIGVKKQVKHINETIALLIRMNEYVKNITRKLEPFEKKLASRVMNAIYSLNVTNNCLTSILKIVKGLSDGQLWAIKFIDAWGGIPSGLTEGRRTSFGEYDQCLELKSPAILSGPTFRGQYCLARIITPYPSPNSYKKGEKYDRTLDIFVKEAVESPLNDGVMHPAQRKVPANMAQMLTDFLDYEKGSLFKFGICIPSSCSPLDLENAINKVVNPITRFPIELEHHCDVQDKPRVFNNVQILGIAFFTFLILCALLSTSYDVYMSKTEENYGELQMPSTKSDLYLSFSIIRNTKTLFVAAPTLSCLDGIRLVFMLWIVFMHNYVYVIINLSSINRLNSFLLRFLTDSRYIFHRNLFILDFFFLISGTILSYMMISKLAKSGGRFNYFQYIMFRYLRLIPSVMGSVFVIWLFPLMLSGPIVKDAYQPFVDGCHYSWYYTLFLMNNYLASYPTPVLCNPPTWSLAADFHLYAIAPIILIKMHSHPQTGFIYGIIGVIVGSLCCLAPKFFGISFYYEWTTFESAHDLTLSTRHHFFGTHAHVNSFALGLLLGFILRHKPNLYLGGKIGEAFCWVISISMSFGAMFWHKDWFTEPPNQINLMLYLAFSKIFWCAGWAWIIFACCTGRAQSLNKFLSASWFKPWTKLALGVCLYHTFPIMYRFSTNRYLFTIDTYSVLSGLMLDYIISFFMAYISYILLEIPVANFMQIFLMPKHKPKTLKQQPIQTNNGIVVNLDKVVTRL